MKNDLSEHIALLQQSYQNCRNHVQDSPYYTLYADEKIHHSLQVIGAGNYILKHEKTFQNRDSDFILKAKLAYLFHDIGRFEEIKAKYDYAKENKGKSQPRGAYDHSIIGADVLRKLPSYNDPLIIIPVKHHGHLIDDLYTDEEFTSIKNEQLKKDIETILFLVRDADKVANFNLVKVEQERFAALFYGEAAKDKIKMTIAPELLEQFHRCEPISKFLQHNVAEEILGFIAWVFDMNYKPSFDFMCKAGGVDFLIERLGECTKDELLQQTVAKTIKNYITLRYHKFRELS